MILAHAADEQGTTLFKLLGQSETVPSQDPSWYLGLVQLAPMRDEGGQALAAIAVVDSERGRLLSAVLQYDGDQAEGWALHYVINPAEGMVEAAVQLEQWLALLPKNHSEVSGDGPLQVPDTAPIDRLGRAQTLLDALAAMPADGFDHMLTLLGALLDERRLLITNFPTDLGERLKLIAGLQALMPLPLAARLTFATQTPVASQTPPQLTIGEQGADSASWVFDWNEPTIIDQATEHPYVILLRELWRRDASALTATIETLATLIDTKSGHDDLAAGLAQVAERYQVDLQAQAEGEVATEGLIRALDSSAAPTRDLRVRYLEKLLHNALNNRDTVAGARVAEEMQANAELERALIGSMDQVLEEQPDAVYVFIRNRLIQLGIDESWIPRLQRAARDSLEVAIQDADVNTLAGWLELIAHEPQAYALQDILREAILSAAERAYSDGELGIHLILIAVRRVPDIVDELYENERLMAALETKVRLALQQSSAASLEALIDETPEYFLLAMYHGIEVSDEQLVSLASARRLWTLYESGTRVSLPAIYRPPAVVRLLATETSHRLADDALDWLFDRVINCDDRKLIADTVHHFSDRETLFPRLSHALENDTVPLDRVASIMNSVSSSKSALPRDVIDTYFTLLDYYEWEPEARRLMEALARMITKHHEVRVSFRHLWKLFDCCHEMQIEGAARVTTTQLLLQFGEEEDLTRVVEGVARICRQIHWSKTLQAAVNAWWRDYAHRCSFMQLQRLDRELEAQRHMETQKHILKTVLAMRRWLHSRDPGEFAEAIDTAYAIVEHISEGFDSAHPSDIDSQTIRREVDAIGLGLSSEQRHILANNLRNLAQRIISMAENRSKPSLIRSDDSIDRQLMHGEANPHGSIDVMKWIAGYLDGAHPVNDD